MKKYKRIFTIVIDSLGIGAMEDSEQFGDKGVNTLGHIAERMENFQIPNLRRLGIANLCSLSGLAPEEKPLGYRMVMREMSNGKDTMTGHWEMMGIHTTKPFQTFTDTGFPPELIKELEERTGRTVIGNKSASGTEILDELAEEEIATGHMIVYTSADSVLQICGNEETFGLEELYRCCEIAREITMKEEWRVGRVIARPYVGTAEAGFTRTANRHDFSLEPPARTLLDAVKDAGQEVLAVGKIFDIFAGRGTTDHVYNKSNADGMQHTADYAKRDFRGLCFVNLVDFDMQFGHRRDIDGYANALTEFDTWLGEFEKTLQEDDLVLITADHGCDPGYTKTTDHTREYVPFIAVGNEIKPVDLGTKQGFGTIAATICEALGVEQTSLDGTSVWQTIKK